MQSGAIRRAVEVGQGIKQPAGFIGIGGNPGKPPRSSGPALLERGHDGVTNMVTVGRGLAVRRIVDPVESAGSGPGVQRAARHVKQWATKAAPGERTLRRHGPEPVDTAAPHQPEQHGFGLVITVMGRQQGLASAKVAGERAVTGVPGHCLRTGAGLHGDTLDKQGHIQGFTHGNTMADPVRGVWMQAMIDVQCPERAGQAVSGLYHQFEQDPGVKATAVGDQNARAVFQLPQHEFR